MAIRPTLWRRTVIYAAVLLMLAAVFCLYWRPDMTVELASRLWSCL